MSNDDRTPEEKLAELEAMIAEQDERSRQREAEHNATLIKTLTDQEMARLDLDAITAQLARLLDHLMAARVVDPDDPDEEPGLDVRWIDKEAGEVAVGVWIEGIVYYEDPTGVLYAERAHAGRSEQAIVSDDDGSFGAWRPMAPPPGQAKRN